MTDWFHLREIRIPTIGGCTPASYVLSSGTLISRLDFDAIGDFDGSLFIDNIDVEWGFRAAHLGYQNFGCFDVTMQHTVGDCHVHFLGKLHPLHSPQRHYFIFRNSIRLIRLSYIPVKWKVNELLRIIPRLLVYSFFSEMPIDHFRAGVSGIIDGILFHRQS
jgi:rhamnosyltransferase